MAKVTAWRVGERGQASTPVAGRGHPLPALSSRRSGLGAAAARPRAAATLKRYGRGWWGDVGVRARWPSKPYRSATGNRLRPRALLARGGMMPVGGRHLPQRAHTGAIGQPIPGWAFLNYLQPVGPRSPFRNGDRRTAPTERADSGTEIDPTLAGFAPAGSRPNARGRDRRQGSTRTPPVPATVGAARPLHPVRNQRGLPCSAPRAHPYQGELRGGGPPISPGQLLDPAGKMGYRFRRPATTALGPQPSQPAPWQAPAPCGAGGQTPRCRKPGIGQVRQRSAKGGMVTSGRRNPDGLRAVSRLPLGAPVPCGSFPAGVRVPAMTAT